MSFNFSELKAQVRRVTQDVLGVPALYQDNTMNAPASITARLKVKVDEIGDLSDQGYAVIVQSLDRIVLIPSDYPDLTFKEGGVVTFTDYNLSYRLGAMEPQNGPLTNHWRVSKVKNV